MATIYNIKQQLSSVESRIRNGNLSQKQKDNLFEFENYLFSRGLSITRIYKYMSNSVVICREFPKINITDLSEKSIIDLLSWISRKYENENTRNGYKYTIRKYLEWQKRNAKELIPINLNIKNSKLPEELLTEKEIVSMIAACMNPRDKAIIATIYEAGDRISEHGNPQLKHIVKDEYGFQLTIDGKTGMRKIRLIWSVPYLNAWIDCHPFRDDPESPLWVSYKRPHPKLDYPSFSRIFGRAAKNAGIKKRIYPHLFRHSRCTHLASFLTESQMKIYFGWAGDSKMPKIYVHLSGKDVDDAILKLHGLKKPDNLTVPHLIIPECPKCGEKGVVHSGICKKCGLILNLADAQRVHEMEKKAIELMFKLIKEHPELISLLEKSSNVD